MYEYKIIRVECKKIGTANAKENYHTIIDDYASRGWRLLQLFAPPIAGYGTASYIELVFEKQV
ncbi:MAG TPA: DUF4177 domain-containing protein [Pseudobacteroides sp.]|uniref:DUF4177 domain-containing protein n=1 Tax=Pseudobacteroides sp. TaxID=1968840 RepID=UPI002F93FDAE